MVYHINDKGEIKPCSARNSCPFGGLYTDHYLTVDEAIEYGGRKIAQLPENINLQNNFLNSIGDSTLNKSKLDHILTKITPELLNISNINEKKDYIKNLDFSDRENKLEALKIVHSFGETLFQVINSDQHVGKTQNDLNNYYNAPPVTNSKIFTQLSMSKQSALINALSPYIDFSKIELNYNLGNLLRKSNRTNWRYKSIFIDHFDGAIKAIPNKWVMQSNNSDLPIKLIPLNITEGINDSKLGSYIPDTGELQYNVKLLHDNFKSMGNFSHELTHRFIEFNPKIKDLNRIELELRGSELGKKMDAPTRSNIDYPGVSIIEDKFSDYYAGRTYEDKNKRHLIGSEMFTVGYERLFWNRNDSFNYVKAKDETLDKYTLGILLMFS